MRPVYVLGDLQGGPSLEDFDFKPEGVLHLPDVSLMQLPAWGHGGQTGAALPQQTSQRASKEALRPRQAQDADPRVGAGLRNFFGMGGGSGSESSNVEMVEGGEPPRAPWMQAGASADSQQAESGNFPWELQKESEPH